MLASVLCLAYGYVLQEISGEPEQVQRRQEEAGSPLAAPCWRCGDAFRIADVSSPGRSAGRRGPDLVSGRGVEHGEGSGVRF